MNLPLVSIIVPCYNVAEYIGEAIESVQSQTYTNWELLITDDASTDATCEVVEGYMQADSRIMLYRLNENQGAGIARNNSIKYAKGRFIAFLDADDWWYSNKLELQMQFMLSNGYEFTFTAFEYADKNLNVVGVSHKPDYISAGMMKLGCNIGTPGVIYDTRRIGKMYMPPMRNSEDWSLWINLSEKTQGAYSLNQPLWKYRTLTNSLSRNKINAIKSSIEVYRGVLGWSKIKSIVVFVTCFLPLYLFKYIYNRVDSFLYLKGI